MSSSLSASSDAASSSSSSSSGSFLPSPFSGVASSSSSSSSRSPSFPQLSVRLTPSTAPAGGPGPVRLLANRPGGAPGCRGETRPNASDERARSSSSSSSRLTPLAPAAGAPDQIHSMVNQTGSTPDLQGETRPSGSEGLKPTRRKRKQKPSSGQRAKKKKITKEELENSRRVAGYHLQLYQSCQLEKNQVTEELIDLRSKYRELQRQLEDLQSQQTENGKLREEVKRLKQRQKESSELETQQRAEAQSQIAYLENQAVAARVRTTAAEAKSRQLRKVLERGVAPGSAWWSEGGRWHRQPLASMHLGWSHLQGVRWITDGYPSTVHERGGLVSGVPYSGNFRALRAPTWWKADAAFAVSPPFCCSVRQRTDLDLRREPPQLRRDLGVLMSYADFISHRPAGTRILGGSYLFEVARRATQFLSLSMDDGAFYGWRPWRRSGMDRPTRYTMLYALVVRVGVAVLDRSLSHDGCDGPPRSIHDCGRYVDQPDVQSGMGPLMGALSQVWSSVLGAICGSEGDLIGRLLVKRALLELLSTPEETQVAELILPCRLYRTQASVRAPIRLFTSPWEVLSKLADGKVLQVWSSIPAEEQEDVLDRWEEIAPKARYLLVLVAGNPNQLPGEERFCQAHNTQVPVKVGEQGLLVAGRVNFGDDLSTLHGLSSAVARLDQVPMLNAHIRFCFGGAVKWTELLRHGHSGGSSAWGRGLQHRGRCPWSSHPDRLPFAQTLLSDESDGSSEEEDEPSDSGSDTERCSDLEGDLPAAPVLEQASSCSNTVEQANAPAVPVPLVVSSRSNTVEQANTPAAVSLVAGSDGTTVEQVSLFAAPVVAVSAPASPAASVPLVTSSRSNTVEQVNTLAAPASPVSGSDGATVEQVSPIAAPVASVSASAALTASVSPVAGADDASVEHASLLAAPVVPVSAPAVPATSVPLVAISAPDAQQSDAKENEGEATVKVDLTEADVTVKVDLTEADATVKVDLTEADAPEQSSSSMSCSPAPRPPPGSPSLSPSRPTPSPRFQSLVANLGLDSTPGIPSSANSETPALAPEPNRKKKKRRRRSKKKVQAPPGQRPQVRREHPVTHSRSRPRLNRSSMGSTSSQRPRDLFSGDREEHQPRRAWDRRSHSPFGRARRRGPRDRSRDRSSPRRRQTRR